MGELVYPYDNDCLLFTCLNINFTNLLKIFKETYHLTSSFESLILGYFNRLMKISEFKHVYVNSPTHEAPSRSKKTIVLETMFFSTFKFSEAVMWLSCRVGKEIIMLLLYNQTFYLRQIRLQFIRIVSK